MLEVMWAGGIPICSVCPGWSPEIARAAMSPPQSNVLVPPPPAKRSTIPANANYFVIEGGPAEVYTPEELTTILNASVKAAQGLYMKFATSQSPGSMPRSIKVSRYNEAGSAIMRSSTGIVLGVVASGEAVGGDRTSARAPLPSRESFGVSASSEASYLLLRINFFKFSMSNSSL